MDLPVAAVDSLALSVTNLVQLQGVASSTRSFECEVRLNVLVCAASRQEVGAVVVRDATGVELLQLDDLPQQLQPGDELRIEGPRVLFRRRETGVEISSVPAVDNDGLHPAREKSGAVALSAGFNRFELDWFNGDFAPDLEVSCKGPKMPLQKIPAAVLWHGDNPGANNLPGLLAELYEGNWQSVPNFNWLAPIKTVSATNIGLELYPQKDRAGLRFTGVFAAPHDGIYTFHVRSANGALLFVGNPAPSVLVTGHAAPPPASIGIAGQIMKQAGESLWVAVEGRVGFVTKTGQGLELELHSGNGVVQVKVADAIGVDPAKLFHARVRAKGVGKSISTLEDKLILGRLLVAKSGDLEILEAAPNMDSPPALITAAEQVQLLRTEDAARHLPVRIRGVVTSASGSFTLQDDTRGVYVNPGGITNHLLPVGGETWEVAGHTQPGDFAPVIAAEKLSFLGAGRLPEPAHPTWNQLINGSMDVQWVEIQGVVTTVSSNQISLLMPEGILQVWFEAQNQHILKPALNCYVTIRGVLFAVWDVNTHEVNPGQIFLRNTSININHPAPTDVFDVPLKTPRELLHFDARAASFQSLKVRGVVIYVEPQQVFLNDEKSGLRILPVQSLSLHPGDLVEAAGYPEIGGVSPILREAVVRKLGTESMPAPKILGPDDLTGLGLDATRIQIGAVLLNRRVERAGVVLEMQAGLRSFLARLRGNQAVLPSLRTGSRLELTGVYASLQPKGEPGHGLDSFEVLLDSPGAIKILSQPPWWTLKRSLAAVGALSLLLSLVALWVFQLRRQVNLQTRIIREKAEREATLEERTRIARELHDTLEQALAGLSLQLRALTDSFREMPAKSAEILKVARQMVQHGQDEARRTVRNLRTLALEQGGLPSALSTLAKSTSSGLPVKIGFEVIGTPVPLSSTVENHLLRVSQEAVTNALKHANPNSIQISLHFEPEAVRLAVQDDGRGFDAAKASSSESGHFGLLGMKERMEKIHGKLDILSSPGSGTSVTVVVALGDAISNSRNSHEKAHKDPNRG